MKYKVIGCFLAISLLFLSGCKHDETLAKVNGHAISDEEFTAYLKAKHIDPKDEKRKAIALDQYLEREGLARVIEEKKLLDPVATQVELNEFRKEMLISRYFDQYLTQQVTDDAIHNYYNTHVDQFEEKKIHLAHILIRTNRKMDETERKAKLTTAQEAYSKVHAGKDFSDIAKAYSEDKISGEKGGDLGWMKEGAISKAFSDKVFAMKEGEVSEPFETDFGFHVVKVIEAAQTVKQPFEAVQGQIRY